MCRGRRVTGAARAGRRRGRPGGALVHRWRAEVPRGGDGRRRRGFYSRPRAGGPRGRLTEGGGRGLRTPTRGPLRSGPQRCTRAGRRRARWPPRTARRGATTAYLRVVRLSEIPGSRALKSRLNGRASRGFLAKPTATYSPHAPSAPMPTGTKPCCAVARGRVTRTAEKQPNGPPSWPAHAS